MSWFSSLLEAYEILKDNPDEQEEGAPLPFSKLISVEIDVIINIDGDFCGAEIKPKKSMIVAPSSSAKTSGVNPGPIFEELGYIAGDIAEYIEAKGDDDATFKEKNESYLKLLGNFSRHPGVDSSIKAVFDYASKSRLTKDLIDSGILLTKADESGKISVITKWAGKKSNTPKLFSVKPSTDITKYKINWIVIGDENSQSEIWRRKSIRQSWMEFCKDTNHMRATTGTCYVTGKKTLIATTHPKFRTAPIISADKGGAYTNYRGRFHSADQSFSVGIEETEKAHNALSYITSGGSKTTRIGKYYNSAGDVVICLWVGGLSSDSSDTIINPLESEIEDEYAFNKEAAKTINSDLRVAATRAVTNLSVNEGLMTKKANILLLKQTCKGRYSVAMFKEALLHETLVNAKEWGMLTSWETDVMDGWSGYLASGGMRISHKPSIFDIANIASGRSEKLKQNLIEALMRCIIGETTPPEYIHKKLYAVALRRLRNGIKDEKSGKTKRQNYQDIGQAIAAKDIDEAYKKYKETPHYSLRCAVAMHSAYTYFKHGRSIEMVEQLKNTPAATFGRMFAVLESYEAYANYKLDVQREPKISSNWDACIRTPSDFIQREIGRLKQVYGDRMNKAVGKYGAIQWYMNGRIAEIHETLKDVDVASMRNLDSSFMHGYLDEVKNITDAVKQKAIDKKNKKEKEQAKEGLEVAQKEE